MDDAVRPDAQELGLAQRPQRARAAGVLQRAQAAVPASTSALLGQDEPSGTLAMAFLPPGEHALWKTQLRDGHADPDFAKTAGFPAPILHGLCSYGIVLRELTDGLLGGDASAVAGFTARFAGVVFPGETIRVAGWRTDDGIIASASIDGGERDGSPVLADCVLSLA